MRSRGADETRFVLEAADFAGVVCWRDNLINESIPAIVEKTPVTIAHAPTRPEGTGESLLVVKYTTDKATTRTPVETAQTISRRTNARVVSKAATEIMSDNEPGADKFAFRKPMTVKTTTTTEIHHVARFARVRGPSMTARETHAIPTSQSTPTALEWS